MKKLISIALAAVMLAAASVPTFAANPITKETDNTGTAIVKMLLFLSGVLCPSPQAIGGLCYFSMLSGGMVRSL